MSSRFWENGSSQRANQDGGHYSISRIKRDGYSMEALRTMFPDGQANYSNFVLFSTSGIHGSYSTIEEVECDRSGDVTFLIIRPRLVAMNYGNCIPLTRDDFDFLKSLRASSHSVLKSIGIEADN